MAKKKKPAPAPTADDDKYLIVYDPWPGSRLPWEDEAKEIICRWLACFIPAEHILMMYTRTKPSDVILVVISPKVQELRPILGEHIWSEFDPECSNLPADKCRRSRVYLSKDLDYDTAIRNPGWEAGEYMPPGVVLRHKKLASPYPLPHYCPLASWINPGTPRWARDMPKPEAAPSPLLTTPDASICARAELASNNHQAAQSASQEELSLPASHLQSTPTRDPNLPSPGDPRLKAPHLAPYIAALYPSLMLPHSEAPVNEPPSINDDIHNVYSRPSDNVDRIRPKNTGIFGSASFTPAASTQQSSSHPMASSPTLSQIPTPSIIKTEIIKTEPIEEISPLSVLPRVSPRREIPKIEPLNEDAPLSISRGPLSMPKIEPTDEPAVFPKSSMLTYQTPKIEPLDDDNPLPISRYSQPDVTPKTDLSGGDLPNPLLKQEEYRPKQEDRSIKAEEDTTMWLNVTESKVESDMKMEEGISDVPEVISAEGEQEDEADAFLRDLFSQLPEADSKRKWLEQDEIALKRIKLEPVD